MDPAVLTAVRDHLKNVLAQLDAQKNQTQAHVDAIEAELAKPEAPVADQLKALIARL